jgi:hypothetical protein
MIRVASFHDAHGLGYVFGLRYDPVGDGSFVHFQGDLYHAAAFSRRAPVLCILSVSSRWLGKAAFEGLRRERSRRRVPSLSMAKRRRGRQQVNECCSVYVPTTISQTSMLRALRVAIGLFDYSQPVMVARTIALPRYGSSLRGVSFAGSADPQTLVTSGRTLGMVLLASVNA